MRTLYLYHECSDVSQCVVQFIEFAFILLFSPLSFSTSIIDNVWLDELLLFRIYIASVTRQNQFISTCFSHVSNKDRRQLHTRMHFR